MSASQLPVFHVTDTVVPSVAGKTLVMPFNKGGVSNERTVELEHIKSLIPTEIASDLKTLIAECVADGSFSADTKEKYVLRVPNTSNCGYKHVVLVGTGSKSADNNQTFKDIGKQLFTLSKDLKAPHLDLLLSSEPEIHSILLGVEDASYDDKRYKGSQSRGEGSSSSSKVLESLSFINIPTELVSSVSELVSRQQLISVGVHIAKDLVGKCIN